MAVVDILYAQWLKAEALFALGTVVGAQANWGDKALDSTTISPLANAADAATEATAQAAFLGAGPLAIDKATVTGQRQDLTGQVITITGDRYGYEGAGKVVFVLGAAEQDNGTTILTVLRRLI